MDNQQSNLNQKPQQPHLPQNKLWPINWQHNKALKIFGIINLFFLTPFIIFLIALFIDNISPLSLAHPIKIAYFLIEIVSSPFSIIQPVILELYKASSLYTSSTLIPFILSFLLSITYAPVLVKFAIIIIISNLISFIIFVITCIINRLKLNKFDLDKTDKIFFTIEVLIFLISPFLFFLSFFVYWKQ